MKCWLLLVIYKKSKPKNIAFLGLDNSLVSQALYIRMVPELAACQAQGIIMRDVPPLKSACFFQFDNRFLPYILFSEPVLFYNHGVWMSNVMISNRQVEGNTLHKL